MLRLLSPAANGSALRELVRAAVRYRELLWEMTRRDLFERHAGSMLGVTWVFAVPVLVMLVQTFVFSFIFNLRLGGAYNGLSFPAYLLAGLVPWFVVQEVISRAPTCITEAKNLVKQIVFPTEILPLKIVLATLVILGIGLMFPMVLMIGNGTARPLWWLLLPWAVLSHLLLMAGFSYFLAATAVFIRDIKNVVQLLLMVGLFLHPILYAPEMLPHWAETAFQFSPISHVIYLYRDVLIFGGVTRPWSWALAPILGLIFLVVGYRVFRNLRHAFGDAL